MTRRKTSLAGHAVAHILGWFLAMAIVMAWIGAVWYLFGFEVAVIFGIAMAVINAGQASSGRW